MTHDLHNRSATPMMEESGLTRHLAALDQGLNLGIGSDAPILTNERIAYYLERGSQLRSAWWISRIKGAWGVVVRLFRQSAQRVSIDTTRAGFRTRDRDDMIGRVG